MLDDLTVEKSTSCVVSRDFQGALEPEAYSRVNRLIWVRADTS